MRFHCNAKCKIQNANMEWSMQLGESRRDIHPNAASDSLFEF
jgi:hypothetical protein